MHILPTSYFQLPTNFSKFALAQTISPGRKQSPACKSRFGGAVQLMLNFALWLNCSPGSNNRKGKIYYG